MVRYSSQGWRGASYSYSHTGSVKPWRLNARPASFAQATVPISLRPYVGAEDAAMITHIEAVAHGIERLLQEPRERTD